MGAVSMDLYTLHDPTTPRHTPAADRLTALVLEVFRVYGLIEAHGTRLSQPHGESTARWRVLGAVARAEGREAVSQLARRMGLTRQGVQRTANALERDGLIEFAANPEHRRSPLVQLTSKGETVLHRLAKAQIAWSNAAAVDFDMDALDRAAAVLRQLAERLSSDDPPPAGENSQ